MFGVNYCEVGKSPVRLTKLAGLADLAVNSHNGETAIVNQVEQSILLHAIDGRLVLQLYYGESRLKSTRFKGLCSLAFSPKGTLAVCDKESRTIQVLGQHGRKFERMFGNDGTSTDQGQLMSPCCVDWLSDEQLVVLDTASRTNNHNRIIVFTRHGTLAAIHELELEVQEPVNLCINTCGPLQRRDLWSSSWCIPETSEAECIQGLGQSIGRPFCVRQLESGSFRLLWKKFTGRIPTDASSPAKAGLSAKETHSSALKPSIIPTKSASVPGVAGVAVDKGTALEPATQLPEWLGSIDIDFVDDQFVTTASSRFTRRMKMVKRSSEGQEEKPQPQVCIHPTLTDAVRYIVKCQGLSWPKEQSMRRHKIAVVDRAGSCIHIFGYVAGQCHLKGLKSYPITPARFFQHDKVTSPELFQPSAACFDPHGVLIVLDTGQRKIVIVQPEGLVLHTFSLPKAMIAESSHLESSQPEQNLPATSTASQLKAVEVGVASQHDQFECGIVYNHTSRFWHQARGLECGGCFTISLSGEVLRYQDAIHASVGNLALLPSEVFASVCRYLSFGDAPSSVCVCRTLRDHMQQLRWEWKLHPLSRQALLAVKQSFVDWARLLDGQKPQNFKAPELSGTLSKRRIICRHWLESGKCPYQSKCPQRMYEVLDEDIIAQGAVMEFEHDLLCALSTFLGFIFWYKHEAILALLFDMLATERDLVIRTHKITKMPYVQLDYQQKKVLDFPAYVRLMRIIVEHHRGAKHWKAVPRLREVNLAQLERPADIRNWKDGTNMIEYEVEKTMEFMSEVLD